MVCVEQVTALLSSKSSLAGLKRQGVTLRNCMTKDDLSCIVSMPEKIIVCSCNVKSCVISVTICRTQQVNFYDVPSMQGG